MQKFSFFYLSVAGMLGSLLPGVPGRAVFRPILFAFLGLGFHVGVWAVLVADLARSANLTPGRLGLALAVMTLTGIVALMFGGRLADLYGRRAFLLIGAGGTGTFFLTLSLLGGSGSFIHLLVVLGFGGVCASSWDLAVNSLASDYESEHGVRVMTFLHAGFSASAGIGAISSGVLLWLGFDFRVLYAVVGVALILLALLLSASQLPKISANLSDDSVAETAEPGFYGLLLAPVVLACVVMVFLSFSTDAILEGFLSVYLRDELLSGPLLGGVALAALYSAAAVGRFASGIVLRKLGERRVLAMCGAASAVGMTCVIVAENPLYSAAALLIVGLATSPVAPILFSIAGRAVPGASGRIIATVTISGYAAFTLGPLIVGLVADFSSLRISLLLPAVSSTGLMLLAMFFLPRKS